MKIKNPYCRSPKLGHDGKRWRNHQRAGSGCANNHVDVTSIKKLEQIFFSQDKSKFGRLTLIEFDIGAGIDSKIMLN
ncbi:MAG: hypothetical protein ACREOR_01335 [Candidatus Binatia bacterium]